MRAVVLFASRRTGECLKGSVADGSGADSCLKQPPHVWYPGFLPPWELRGRAVQYVLRSALLHGGRGNSAPGGEYCGAGQR